jgi:hypothetical protein
MARKKGRRSGFEVRVEQKLQDTYEYVGYEAMKLKYQRAPQTYVVDFICDHKNGAECPVLFEAKGRFTRHDRTKMLAVKKAHPDLDIRLVFQRNNPIYKGSKTRYLDWAKAHGFPASVFPELPI